MPRLSAAMEEPTLFKSKSRPLQHELDVPSDPNRWSEIVPPKSALTFAVIWDPQEGMVTFTGAQLFESQFFDKQSCEPPLDVVDSSSQLLLTETYSAYLNSGCATFAQTSSLDVRSYLESFLRPPVSSPYRDWAKQSTTASGVDVYARNSYSSVHLMQGYSSPHKQDAETLCDARGVLAVGDDTGPSQLRQRLATQRNGRPAACDTASLPDEGFFEGTHACATACSIDPIPVVSHFSISTTSTSNFVEVDTDIPPNGNISNSSVWLPFEELNNNECRCKRFNGRRLRKRGYLTKDSEVHRHLTPGEHHGVTAHHRQKLASLARFCVSKLVGRVLDERWVCVDVTEEIEITRRLDITQTEVL